MSRDGVGIRLSAVERSLNELKVLLCNNIDAYVDEMVVREKLPESGKYKSGAELPGERVTVSFEYEIDCGFLENKNHFAKASMVIIKEYKK